MADPFTGLAEGIQKGTQLGLMAKQRKMEEQKAVAAKQQQQFENVVNRIKMNADVMSRNVAGDFKNLAGQNLLKGYKDLATMTGMDPSTVPDMMAYDPKRDDEFIKQIGGSIKAYEDKVIGKNDLRINLLMLGKRWQDATGRDPDISGLGENVIGDKTKPRARMETQMGDQKVAIQETEPGSGDFTPIKVNGQTATAPVAAPSEERGKMVEGLNQLDALNSIDKLYDPDFVGMYEGGVKGKLKSKTGIGVDPLEAQFRAETAKMRAQIRKFYFGSAQSKQELQGALEAIPDPDGMSSTAFEAAMDSTRRNIRSMLRRSGAAASESGLAVPSDVNFESSSDEDLIKSRFSKPKPVSTGKGKGSLDDPKYWK
jgi:hypothetical protein